MSTLPCFIFRAPGPIRRARYSYSTMTVASQSQLDEKLASGWHLTLEQAIDAAGESASRHLAKRKVRVRKVRVQVRPQPRRASAKRAAAEDKAVPLAPAVVVEAAPVEIPAAVPDDNAAPTRIELVAKATELGLKFTKRTSDEKLLALIEAALKQPEEV